MDGFLTNSFSARSSLSGFFADKKMHPDILFSKGEPP
jgi:hypothetical protein